MSIDVSEFVDHPTREGLERCNKAQLREVAKQCQIELEDDVRKDTVREMIIDHYLKKNVFTKNLTNPVDVELEIKKYELECKVKIEMENIRVESEKYIENLRLEANKEIERIRINAETATRPNKRFDASRHIHMVPQFSEHNVDSFFFMFEKIAESMEWPKDKWCLLIQGALKGKAQSVYAALTVEQCHDYEYVKGRILKAYALVPEAYRQQFRELHKIDTETFVEFARRKEVIFDKWCKSVDVNGDIERLRQMVLLDEYKRCVGGDISMYLNEKHVDDMSTAAELSDSYAIIHADYDDRHQTARDSQAHTGDVHAAPVATHSPSVRRRESGEFEPTFGAGRIVCYYCNRPGHIQSNCWQLQYDQAHRSEPTRVAGPEQTEPTTSAAVSQGHNRLTCTSQGAGHGESGQPVAAVRAQGGYHPFISDGSVSVKKRFDKKVVTVLRDTGAGISLMTKSALPRDGNTFTGRYEFVRGVGGRCCKVPIHKIYLRSKFVNSEVTVGVIKSLPIQGITFLLGNDIGGDIVYPVPTR